MVDAKWAGVAKTEVPTSVRRSNTIPGGSPVSSTDPDQQFTSCWYFIRHLGAVRPSPTPPDIAMRTTTTIDTEMTEHKKDQLSSPLSSSSLAATGAAGQQSPSPLA